MVSVELEQSGLLRTMEEGENDHDNSNNNSRHYSAHDDPAMATPSIHSHHSEHAGTGTSTVSLHRPSNCRELLACVVLFGLFMIPGLVWKTPHQRPLPIQIVENTVVKAFAQNETLDKETIPDYLLVILGVLLPLGIQIGLQMQVVEWWRHLGDIQATLCVYLVAVGLTVMCTDLLKLYVGYLRPVFFDVCNFDGQECENDDNDVRKSFPSGHASISFCGLTLLTLFLHGLYGVKSIKDATNRYTEDPFRRRFVSLLSLLPMGLAGFIAASRVVDNKHFPADVVGGSVLGASVANFVYNLWF